MKTTKTPSGFVLEVTAEELRYLYSGCMEAASVNRDKLYKGSALDNVWKQSAEKYSALESELRRAEEA